MYLAIKSWAYQTYFSGIQCKDPTFGLDAWWIAADKRENAQNLGYTVVMRAPSSQRT